MGEKASSRGAHLLEDNRTSFFAFLEPTYICFSPKSEEASPTAEKVLQAFQPIRGPQKTPKGTFSFGRFSRKSRSGASRPAALPCPCPAHHKHGDRGQGGNQGNQRPRQNKQDAHDHVEGDGLVQEKEGQNRGQRGLEEKDQ